MDGTDLVLKAVEDGVAALTLNRPRALNALSRDLVRDLAAALDEAEADPGVRAIVLAGAAGNFAAGADLAEMLGMDAAEVFATDFSGCCDRLAACGKPVLAAVEGYALGGGCELVEMCDVVVAAEGAVFGHPELTVGTIPGAGGTQRLTRAVGKCVAMDMLLTGRRLSAAEALQAGLVSRVVPRGEAVATALDLARRVAGLSAPIARLGKQAVRHAQESHLAEGLALERRLFQLSFVTHDRREGMAAFVEKRRPAFRDA